MTDTSAAKIPKAPAAAKPGGDPARDGRRLRGEDNRARIVTAMLELVRDGSAAPSAEQVAARADVGLRTVFRHFQDMDSLYSEMSVAIEDELRAITAGPLQSTDWRDRLRELIERRALAFEKIAPFANASTAFRHRSKVLQTGHARLVTFLRTVIETDLPTDVTAEAANVEILDLLLSFEAWSRLRLEQGLSAKDARNVLEQALIGLTTPKTMGSR